MGVLILGNKSVVKRKSYITMLVFISTIIILFLIVNMNENSSKIKVKGGEGYGMFDKATRIEIIFNDNEYIVSNPDEIEQIIRLCRQNWEPSNTHITKEDCDMCVKFIGTDTEVWVDTETLSSYIGESFVQMPEDLFKKIKEVVSLSNTLRSMPIFQCIYKEKFYCSQLVWAAFKDNYGIDLDTSDFGDAVHPMELVNSSKTYTIYKK